MITRLRAFAIAILIGWLAVYVLALIQNLPLLANAAAVFAVLIAAAALFGAGAVSFYRDAIAENGDETK